MGIEIELSGLTLEEAAQVVLRVFGGRVEPSTEYELKVEGSGIGSIRLEIDDAKLKELGRKKAEEEELGLIDQSTEAVLSALAGRITPLEIVTSPLRIEDIPLLDDLVRELGQAGGRGTEDGILLAFGTHFNPEVASTDPGDLLAHLQAFVLLFDWLSRDIDVDLTRRALPFIDPFPPEYVAHVLRRSRSLTREELIDEHLAFNPTRNRALDMLPLFAHLDEERVRSTVDDPRIKSRPTFHYRLSNARVGDDRWRLGEAWKRWLIVEDLAAERSFLDSVASDYLSAERSREEWAERTSTYLEDAGS